MRRNIREEQVLIEVKNLCKNYGAIPAVRDVSFTVEKGKIYGFLGPNGAGKSTTMNMITGCLAPTSGQVLVDGYDIYDEAHTKFSHLSTVSNLFLTFEK